MGLRHSAVSSAGVPFVDVQDDAVGLGAELLGQRPARDGGQGVEVGDIAGRQAVGVLGVVDAQLAPGDRDRAALFVGRGDQQRDIDPAADRLLLQRRVIAAAQAAVADQVQLRLGLGAIAVDEQRGDLIEDGIAGLAILVDREAPVQERPVVRLVLEPDGRASPEGPLLAIISVEPGPSIVHRGDLPDDLLAEGVERHRTGRRRGTPR